MGKQHLQVHAPRLRDAGMSPFGDGWVGYLAQLSHGGGAAKLVDDLGVGLAHSVLILGPPKLQVKVRLSNS